MKIIEKIRKYGTVLFIVLGIAFFIGFGFIGYRLVRSPGQIPVALCDSVGKDTVGKFRVFRMDINGVPFARLDDNGVSYFVKDPENANLRNKLNNCVDVVDRHTSEEVAKATAAVNAAAATEAAHYKDLQKRLARMEATENRLIKGQWNIYNLIAKKKKK